MTPDTEWYTSDYDSFGEMSFELEEYLWPQKEFPEDDLNIMYLSLFGKSWGNMETTVKLLKNTKTL
ncbi:MAG: hypothetical protein H6765_04110 [Candidatus Peribacteria bacterium]|nr:MAG: hypothetical protein H6765_04110 [Candidatus Peribacteria bacterium]